MLIHGDVVSWMRRFTVLVRKLNLLCLVFAEDVKLLRRATYKN